MVQIRKVKLGKGTYYYLEQSIRKANGVRKKRLYLGKTIPKNINKLKENFIREIYSEEWYPIFNSIKGNYLKELKRMPDIAKDKMIEAFMVAFTYDTQKIEGSRLSFRDTGQVLLEQTTPKGARIGDIKEAEAHRKVFYEMLEYTGDISLSIILKWHKELLSETEQNIAGKIRDFNIRITNSSFKPPDYAYMESMLGNFFAWYKENERKMNPVELAALVHLKFVTIHPFGDGNGRMSRLLMNFVLKKNSYPMLNIRYVNRRSYYVALENSQVKEDENIFLKWFFRRYAKDNRQYLR
jgi:Fic family protein